MFLKFLNIYDNDQIIRKIPFHKGLNLIIDETKTTNKQESGNSVGKTTVLRLIDFCLGGDGINIYQDPEFSNKNDSKIEDYLKNNNIIIHLLLIKNIDDDSSEKISIRKNFLKGHNKIMEINDQTYSTKDKFDKKLKELIFNSNEGRPTFRQIISKNIRYEKSRLENTLRVLHATSKQEEYEALYFFWLGISTETAIRKQKIQSEKSIEEGLLNRLKRGVSFSELVQAISVLDDDINILNELKDNFNVNKDFEADLNRLNDVKKEINALSTYVSRLNLRKEIIEETKVELESNYSKVDVSHLKEIYVTAKSYVPSLQIKFNEMLSFHNNMLNERVKFITKELPFVEHDLNDSHRKLDALILQENDLTENLKKLGVLEGLEDLITKLNQRHEQRGAYAERLSQWNAIESKLAELDGELDQINAEISLQNSLIETRIGEFNKFFSKMSEKLYGEQMILSHDHNGRAYTLKVSSIGGNLGTGKKKGQIAAFDFAYIQFCDKLNIPCIHFVLHDQIENIHDNQLILISEVVNETNVQFIVPVLRDKLPPGIDPDHYKVLSLSQDSKLFKVS